MSRHPLGIPTHPYERIAAGETEMIDEIVEVNKRLRKDENGQEIRSQHGKTTAAALGRLMIRADLPPEMMSWLPENDEGHAVTVRFSNGNQHDDRVPDAHGCAIRIQDVADTPVVTGLGSKGIHDLVLVDSPIFFVSGVAEYLEFSNTVAPSFFKGLALNVIDMFKNDTEMRDFKLKELTKAHPDIGPRVAEFSSKTFSSPLRIEYTSATPYALGDRAMRWVLTPEIPEEWGSVTTENGLTDAVRNNLLNGAASFTLSVRLASDPVKHSAENETVSWDDAHDYPVADLVLGRQRHGELETLIKGVEQMAFSPWHAPMHLRPIGGINRCRGKVYSKMANLRGN